MANIIVTPNMSLPTPIPSIDPGPDYAIQNTNCFDIIDSHNHAPGSGVQINPAGILINSALTFNNNDLTNAHSVGMFSLAMALSTGSYQGVLYVVGNELFYNDVTGGHQVQVTNNGSVNSGAGSITGLPSGTASAAYNSGTGTFVWQQATATAANMDAATYILRYPGSYPTPVGNFIAIEAPAAISGGYSFTLPAAAPAHTGFLLMDTSGTLSTLTTAGGITSTNIATHGVAYNNLPVPNQTQQSSSAVTPLTLNATGTVFNFTFATSGRPVLIFLTSDETQNDSYMEIGFDNNTGLLDLTASVKFVMNVAGTYLGVPMYSVRSTSTKAVNRWPVNQSWIFTPPAGTNTYLLQVTTATNGSAGSPPDIFCNMSHIQMFVTEI